MNNSSSFNYSEPLTGLSGSVSVLLFGSFLSLATVLGNSLVLVAFASRRSLRSVRSNVFIMGLALTDVIVGGIVMPIHLHYLYHDLVSLKQNLQSQVKKPLS